MLAQMGPLRSTFFSLGQRSIANPSSGRDTGRATVIRAHFGSRGRGVVGPSRNHDATPGVRIAPQRYAAKLQSTPQSVRSCLTRGQELVAPAVWRAALQSGLAPKIWPRWQQHCGAKRAVKCRDIGRRPVLIPNGKMMLRCARRWPSYQENLLFLAAGANLRRDGCVCRVRRHRPKSCRHVDGSCGCVKVDSRTLWHNARLRLAPA
jgi:hypothetical protein